MIMGQTDRRTDKQIDGVSNAVFYMEGVTHIMTLGHNAVW